MTSKIGWERLPDAGLAVIPRGWGRAEPSWSRSPAVAVVLVTLVVILAVVTALGIHIAVVRWSLAHPATLFCGPSQAHLTRSKTGIRVTHRSSARRLRWTSSPPRG